MSTIDLRNTVADIIAELSKLPADQVVAIPVRWTLDTVNEMYADLLKAPLTSEQWADVAGKFLDGLPSFFWEDSENIMTEALEGFLNEEES
jgi:hypothetical protein